MFKICFVTFLVILKKYATRTWQFWDIWDATFTEYYILAYLLIVLLVILQCVLGRGALATSMGMSLSFSE
jgi:hypothetical protein